MICKDCPRQCGIDRALRAGACGAMDRCYVARAALHRWEEPCISGTGGSGAVFFCGCNLNCVFCQNHTINRTMCGEALDREQLAACFLRLQDLGAHNINLVTPVPHLHILREAIPLAKEKGLRIPIVYNTNAYELTESLRTMEGLVDIYLPDLKYVSGIAAKKYSGAEDYFKYAAPAILEMYRQCGDLVLDENGIAKRGIIIRHLVLPGSLDETRDVLDFIAEHLPLTTHISLMGQYVPAHRAEEFPPLHRRLTRREYDRAVDYCLSKGFVNVYIQQLSAASSEFTPEFNGYFE